MAFVLKPCQPAGAVTRASGFPIRPGRSGGAAPLGLNPLDARVLGLQRLVHANAPGPVPTWMAQLRAGTVAVGILGQQPIFSSNYTYFLCDPTLVDWPSITRNGRAPWAGLIDSTGFSGSLVPYVKNIGTAAVIDPATPTLPPVFEVDATEVRWPIVTGNTVTEIRKPPYMWGAPDFTFLTETDIRVPQAEGYTFDNIGGYGGYGYYLLRYLGADLDIAFGPDSVGFGWTMYAGLADPVTLECSSFTAIATGAGGTSATVTAAQMAAFGFSPWDQIFFAAFYSGVGIAPPSALPLFFWGAGDYVVLTPIAPIDIPPPYDMPGIDDWLPGGYFV